MNPILLDIPDSLTTERLIVRMPTAGDGTEVNAAIRESHEELRQWMSWALDIPEVEATEALSRENQVDFLKRSQFSFNLYLKSTGEFVGKTALFNIDWSVPKLEIGYWIRTRFAGQGLMTEAIACLVQFSFDTLNMRRIEIRCDPHNRRSAAIPVRLGFTLEGIIRNDQRNPQGELRDTAIYALVR